MEATGVKTASPATPSRCGFALSTPTWRDSLPPDLSYATKKTTSPFQPHTPPHELAQAPIPANDDKVKSKLARQSDRNRSKARQLSDFLDIILTWHQHNITATTPQRYVVQLFSFSPPHSIDSPDPRHNHHDTSTLFSALKTIAFGY